MKVKLLTHNDLDAAGCAIQVILAYGRENVSVEYHNHKSLEKRWNKFTALNENGKTEYDEYDLVIVADIAPTEEWAAIIDTIDLKKKFVVLDHHRSAEFLNKYEWATVREEHYEGKKASGTSLVYRYLANQEKVKVPYFFVNYIREFDTWEWQAKNNVAALELARLSVIYSTERFVDKYVNLFTGKLADQLSPEKIFNENDKFVLEIEALHIQDYLEKKERHIKEYTIEGYKAAVMFADNYFSELGNYIASKYPEYDIVVMINATGEISYRCVKDIDLSVIAKKFGGGGHPRAAGSPFTEEHQDRLIKDYFKLNAE